MMKLSVIIPCYNSATFLGDQLEALATQQYKGEWEVIISDNGSTDRSIEIAKGYRSRLPELKIVDSSDKKGAGHARNVGVKVATGDGFLFCDADDAVGAGWLSAMANALGMYDFVAGAFEGSLLNPGAVFKGRPVPQTHSLQEYDYPKFFPHAGGGNLGVRRHVHERVGGFNESMPRLQDTDYCWRIQLAGVELHFVADAVLHMRLQNTLIGSLKQAFLWGRYNVLLYKTYRQHGMPPLFWKKGVRIWLNLLKAFPRLRTRVGLEKWLRQIIWRLGRIDGCLRYKVLAI
jgi:glycosyltransferase involved in cell wall biosynthesis